MAWGILLLASGDNDAAARAVHNARYWSRLQVCLAAIRSPSTRAACVPAPTPRSSTPTRRNWRRILDRADVLATGISEADAVGLVGGGSAVEVSAPAARRDVLVREHGLESGHGPVRIRWVRDEIWPLLDREHDGRAPRAAVLVDLLETTTRAPAVRPRGRWRNDPHRGHRGL
jgi:hypothetical protein